MGKVDNQPLPVVQQQVSGTLDGRRRSVDVSRHINFKCAAVLTLSVAAFLFAVSWVLPFWHRHPGFDAKDSIKRSATVQAFFRLNKPVKELVPYIARLEYDLSGEIGVPSSKVAVLSMHQEGKSNWTDVVFGFLPYPINNTINPASLSLLKSSLVDIFLQQYNLTVDSSLFGDTSSFEILQFPGGITITHEQPGWILPIPQVLFNFTLNSSIFEIKDILLELKEQLKLGLHLMLNEMVYIQVMNKDGSTIDPPVTVEASVVSDIGTLRPERLKQLAQTIAGSAENLGLDHSVFGKVKEISLSSFLNHSLDAQSPSLSPSPAPSPEQIFDYGPSLEPSSPPALPPNFHYSTPPGPNCYAPAPSEASQTLHPPSPSNLPHHSIPPRAYSPRPSVAHDIPYGGSTDPPGPSPTSHPDNMPPAISSPPFTQSPQAGPLRQMLPSDSPWSSGTLRTRWFNLLGLIAVLLLI